MLKASEVLERNYHEGILPKTTLGVLSGSSYTSIKRACAICQLAIPFAEREGERLLCKGNIYGLVSKSYGIPVGILKEVERMFEDNKKTTLEISQWLGEQGY